MDAGKSPLVTSTSLALRQRHQGTHIHYETSEVVQESAIELYVNGYPYVTVAMTPRDLKDFTYGFLASENLLTNPEDLTIFQWRPKEQQIWVRIKGLSASALRPQEGRYLGSCCGQSRPGFLSPTATLPALPPNTRLSSSAIPQIFGDLNRWMGTQHSGGFHGAGYALQNRLMLVRADVGRHNALDKVYGAALAQHLAPLSSGVIAFTGRLSAEIVWKVAKMGCPILISNAAPTSLGLELGQRLGVTLIGFARAQGFSVYCHPERVCKASC